MMTKCQQYFVTDPSRSVDFQKQDTDPEPETRSEVTVETMRKVEFTSSKGTEEQQQPSSSNDASS